jgi:hypothetical protein
MRSPCSRPVTPRCRLWHPKGAGCGILRSMRCATTTRLLPAIGIGALSCGNPANTTPPAAENPYACLESASQIEVVTGHHEEKFVPAPASGEAFDARSADFLNRNVDHGMISLRGEKNQPGMCWAGGYVTTDKPWDASWSDHKDESGPTRNSCALDDRATGLTVTGLHFFNVGDGVRVNGGTNWVVQHSWAEYVRDDCIEDDEMAGGEVFDALFDGCYAGISVESTSNASGSNNVVVFDRVLLRIQAMPYPYEWQSESGVIDEDGRPYSGVGMPYGHGSLFKLGDLADIPRFSISNSVFAATHLTRHDKLDFPPAGRIVACENNTVIWLGPGDYPGALPNARFPGCVKVVTGQVGRQLWRQRVTDWHARHPGVGANRKPRDPGNLDFPKVF